MNAQLNLELGVLIFAGPAMRLQMVHNRTAPTAVGLIEFVLAARGEVPLGIHVLQVELLGPLQDLVAAAATDHDPVVAGVALHGFAEARYLLLSAQRAADQVRVQVLFRVGVAQADLLAALDGFTGRADLVIIGLSDNPKAGRLVPLWE